MPTYRFHPVSKSKDSPRRNVVRDFDSDPTAIKDARALADGHTINVWLGERVVGRVMAQNKPHTVNMRKFLLD